MIEFSSQKEFKEAIRNIFNHKKLKAEQPHSKGHDIIFDKVLNINIDDLLNTKLTQGSVIQNILNEEMIDYDGEQLTKLQSDNFIRKTSIHNRILDKDFETQIINDKTQKGVINEINVDNLTAYYSKPHHQIFDYKNDNIVIFLSNGKDFNKNYISYADEYLSAGYDFFIVNIENDKNAGLNILNYLLKKQPEYFPTNLLIHGHNDQREDALLLYKNTISTKNKIHGVILSSYNNESELSIPINSISDANIYIAYDNPLDDYKNNALCNELLAKNNQVKKFSFSLRDEYHHFEKINKEIKQRLLVPLPTISITPASEDNIKIGMPAQHQKIFSQVANKKDFIIGVRPVDPSSTSLIESGEYSSKNLAVKAKSADWGPMAGFIPVNQSLAKLSAQNNTLKYNNYVKEAIENGAASTCKLLLSTQRVSELVNNGLINIEERSANLLKFDINNNHQIHKFVLELIVDNGKQYYLVQREINERIEPVFVISDPISNKPMIADYDLFTVIYPYYDLGLNTRIKIGMPWEE